VDGCPEAKRCVVLTTDLPDAGLVSGNGTAWPINNVWGSAFSEEATDGLASQIVVLVMGNGCLVAWYS
jgi:hypothetical protein